MKLQAILVIVLQAQSALAFEGSQRHSGIAACSIPCRTHLRLNEIKMRQCLQAHCGAQVTEIEKKKNPCVARCMRLGRLDCPEKCPTDDFYVTTL